MTSTTSRGFTSRGDVHYVVTEYGVAELWGKNIRERTMALIEIAHPDFRPELLAAAKHKHYVFPEQPPPRAVASPPAVHVPLEGGERIRIRSVKMADQTVLQDLFYRLSDDSTYQRFLGHKKCHPRDEIMKLADIDCEQSMALVAEAENSETGELVAMARYDLDPETRLADVALVVLDEYQGKGLGTALFKELVTLAKAHGVAGFTADVLVNNGRMLGIFNKSGERVETRLDGGVYRVKVSFMSRAVPTLSARWSWPSSSRWGRRAARERGPSTRVARTNCATG